MKSSVRSVIVALAMAGAGCTIQVHVHPVIVTSPAHPRGDRAARWAQRHSSPMPMVPVSPARTEGTMIECAGSRWFTDATTGRTWSEARAHCERNNGQLASIASADEQRCVEAVLQQAGASANGAWIDLHEQSSEGNWQWASGAPTAYTRWLSGEPNDDSGGPADCAHVWRERGYQWNDIPCARTDQTFVCRMQ